MTYLLLVLVVAEAIAIALLLTRRRPATATLIRRDPSGHDHTQVRIPQQRVEPPPPSLFAGHGPIPGHDRRPVGQGDDPGPNQLYAGLGPKELLVGPPMVSTASGPVVLKEWLIHHSFRKDQVWSDVVARFYHRAAEDPEVAGYFTHTDMTTLQNHFCRALMLVTSTGLSAGAVQMLQAAHGPVRNPQGVGITDAVFDKVVGVLAAVLAEEGVPDATIIQVANCVKPLRTALVTAPPASAPAS